jgi:hypothetical protein
MYFSLISQRLGSKLGMFKENLRQVSNPDRLVDSTGLDKEGWALRYHLEDQLLLLDKIEEEYWRQRSRV